MCSMLRALLVLLGVLALREVEGGTVHIHYFVDQHIKTFDDGHRPPDQVVPSML